MSDSLRVAMIGPFGFHPNKTMRSRALRLARELVRRGQRVKLIMPPWHTPAEAGRLWVEQGVTIQYISLRGGLPLIVARLVREAHAFRPHLIHCFKPKAYSGLAALPLWYAQRVPLLVDSDDWEGWGGWNDRAPYTPLQKQFFAWQEQWGMRHCHALTVASRALETLAWGAGVPPERVHYLPNGSGLDVADWLPPTRPPERPPTLLLYSRLFEFDIERLVAVLQRVYEQRPDLQILAVGAGLYAADAAQLRQQLARANLLQAVVDVGWVDDETQLPPLLASADVGLYLMDDTLLNRTKCPVKLADMLAVGLPVVAERVGQVAEYVTHQQTGLLREVGDVAGLAADLLTLLADPPLAQRLGRRAAQEMAQRLAWSVTAERLLAVYRHLLPTA